MEIFVTVCEHVADLVRASFNFSFPPTSTMIEFDLVMRNNGYTESEISDTWIALASFIEQKLAATTISAHVTASEMRAKGLSYFDLLLTALATEMHATVITRDDEISKYVDTEWE